MCIRDRLEHCYVNLSFENVSVLAEQFLIEFRLASFTVKSRRYVDFSGAGYVAPDFSDPAQAAAFDAAVRALFGIYDELEAAGVPKEMCIRDRKRSMCRWRYNSVQSLWTSGQALSIPSATRKIFR